MPDKILAITRIRTFGAKAAVQRRAVDPTESGLEAFCSRVGCAQAREDDRPQKNVAAPKVMLRDWVVPQLGVIRESELPHSLGRMSIATTVLSLEGKESVLAGGE